MAAESTSFTPTELWAGEVSKTRRAVTVKEGQVLAANTIVMTDADGKVVIHNGITTTAVTQSGTTPFAVTLTPARPVTGVLIAAVDATDGDTEGMIYCDGDFIADKLVWPTTIDGATKTNLTKQKLLEGSNIRATFYTAGETV